MIRNVAPIVLVTLVCVLVLMIAGTLMVDRRQPQVVIDCSGWSSVEVCLRDGFALQWEQLGVEIVGIVEEVED